MKLLSSFLTCLAVLYATAAPAAAESAFEGTIQVGSPQNGGTNPNGKGRQTLGGLSLGLDFMVSHDAGITISALGVWDDNGNQLLSPHVLAVFDLADTSAPLAVLATSPGTGTLIDGYRYFDLPTGLVLDEGAEFSMVVYYGAGNQDSNGNSGKITQDLEPRPLFNSSGGALANIGVGRYGVWNGVGVIPFPGILDTGPENRYHAGSFLYTPNPEPGTLALIAGAVLAAGIVRRRRRNRA